MLTVAKQKNDGDNSCIFAEEDGLKVLGDQSYCNSRADLINLSSVASDNDEIHLSPCVVENKIEKLEENDEGCTMGIFNWKDAIQISNGNDCVEATKEAFREKSYLGPASVTLNRQLLSLEWINEESTEYEPISSSPPVVCSGVKKKTCKNTGIGNSANRDRTKLLDCSGTNREEDDLKRKNRRKRRKEKRGRVGGSNEKPMTSHSEQTNAKEESNRTFDIELKSDDCLNVCVSPGIASSLEYKEKGKINKINKGIDTTTSSPSAKGCCNTSTQYGATSACARENIIPNRDTRNFIGGDSICSPVKTGVGKSHLELACESEKCVQQKRKSNVGDGGKTQSVDSHEESQAELYFSPFKVGTDKQDFSFSPRKESDISETFDLDPPSPTVVSAWKQDIGESSKFSKNNGDDVFGSTPGHRSPVLYDRLPKPLYESDLPHSSAMEKQFTAISPIVSDILPCLDGAFDCVLSSTTENLNSIDDLQGISMGKAVCPDTDGVQLEKKKGSDGKLEKNSESEWVIGSIIEEILERMFSKLEQSWLGESDVKVELETGPLREALSPADVIPKTPAKQKASEASRLKRRINISGANLRRRSSTRKCILTQSVVDLPPGLDSSIATNHTEQLIKSISDHRSVESESGNDDDKHRLGFIECTEQQQECHGLLVYSELPDDGLEQDSVNVPLSLVLRHSTHKDFRDCLRELPEAQEKSSKSKDEEFGLEFSTLTCRKRPVSGISNVEVGTNVPQRFGEQHSIDEVVGSESLLVDTLICHEDPANLSGIPDKDSHTLIENEDLDKSGISSRKGSTNLVYRVANNVIREDAQVLQAVDDNILYDHSSLLSSGNDAEIKDDDVTFTSMEILDDLMFDRKALESDLLTISFKEGPDSLADFSSPSETPEKVFPGKFVGKAIDSCHIKQKDDCLKEERNLLDQIVIAKPCQIKRCEKVLQIPFGNSVECRSKAEESPPSEGVVTNRLELRCPDADKSVMGNGEKSVSDMKMADSEKHDRKSRGNQIMSHLFNDRSCGSEANVFLKSNAKGERNDADLHASLQEFARGDGFIDVINDEAIINITMSDTLLSPKKDVSEATNDNSDNVVCARTSHSCIGEKSDSSNLSFCDKASLAIKKACASACYDTEAGLSQLLNSNFDCHELTQMYEARCEPGQSETLICKGAISKHDGSVLHENRIDSSLEFSTASGRTVDVSEKMQDADKKKLEENDRDGKDKEGIGGFSGFSTASGRKVDISERALDAARKKLEEDDGNSKDRERIDGFTGFSTASGRKVDISEKALDAARKKLEENDGNSKDRERIGGFSGFSTASGRKVDISERALDAARKKLEEDDGNSKDRSGIGGFSGFSTASRRKVDISEKALDAARKKLEENDGNSKDRERIGGFSGFSTASGRKVDISERALDAARKKLEEDDGNSKDRNGIGGFSGFSTASGRKDDISEKALDAARKKLKENDGNSKDRERIGGFSGFSTASGRKVDISERALDAARKKLEENDGNSKDRERIGGFSGFSTASGRKVDISERALDAARKKLEEDDGNSKDRNGIGGFSGFSTASGRKVDISEKALDAARKKLEENDGNSKDRNGIGGFSGFSTASGRKVDISEKALDAARKKLEENDGNSKDRNGIGGFSGFSTASGRKVDISEKALDAARKKLEEDDGSSKDRNVIGGFSGFNTASGRKVDISEKALDAARKKLEENDGNSKDREKIGGFSGFSTASGRKVDKSEKALDAARKKLEENDGNSKDREKIGGFSGFSTASGRKDDISEKALDAARKRLEEDDGSSKDRNGIGGFSGFSTASGRKVDISEKALGAARKKLEEKEGNSKDKERIGGFSGFSTASGRKVDISEKALDAARKKLEENDGNSKDRERIGGFSGFSTASGRKVDISERALDAARKKLEEHDGNSKDRERIGGFSGFNTASGRKVDISEKALDAARKKVEEKEGNSKDKDKTDGFSGFSTAYGKKANVSVEVLDARKNVKSGVENMDEMGKGTYLLDVKIASNENNSGAHVREADKDILPLSHRPVGSCNISRQRCADVLYNEVSEALVDPSNDMFNDSLNGIDLPFVELSERVSEDRKTDAEMKSQIQREDAGPGLKEQHQRKDGSGGPQCIAEPIDYVMHESVDQVRAWRYIAIFYTFFVSSF